MGLEQSVEKMATDIKTDSYAMSVGEIVNLYRDRDLEIWPDYQRYFRWNIQQKSEFIESMLLGLPLPPIFVAVDEDGTWNVIDGLQRLSTILQFMGVLRELDEDDGSVEDIIQTDPEPLVATKFLPELQGVMWKSSEHELPQSLQRKFKRTPFTINIVQAQSNSNTKYEVFRRLNTNGENLSDQEVRNVIMIMQKPELYKIVKNLSENENFKAVLSISEDRVKKQFDKELIVELLIAMDDSMSRTGSRQFGEFLTEQVLHVDISEEGSVGVGLRNFDNATKYLLDTFGTNTFKKWQDNKASGQFNKGLFELILPFLVKNFGRIDLEQFKEKLKHAATDDEFVAHTKAGTQALDRYNFMVGYANQYFAEVLSDERE